MINRIFELFGYSRYYVTFILSVYKRNYLSFVVPIWATSPKEARYKAQCKVDKIGFIDAENTFNAEMMVDKI